MKLYNGANLKPISNGNKVECKNGLQFNTVLNSITVVSLWYHKTECLGRFERETNVKTRSERESVYMHICYTENYIYILLYICWLIGDKTDRFVSQHIVFTLTPATWRMRSRRPPAPVWRRHVPCRDPVRSDDRSRRAFAHIIYGSSN